MSLTTVRLLTETSGVETMQVQDTSALDSLFFFFIYMVDIRNMYQKTSLCLLRTRQIIYIPV